MLKDNRLRIIIGHFGSGKTEFAVNYAVKLAESDGENIAIADLDVINPYFRTREKADFLESMGIKVISSNRGNKKTNLNLPMVSANVLELFQNKELEAILDVGGDKEGATTLGRYKKYFVDGKYDMFAVINANRMETSTVDGAVQHIKNIEAVSGAKVTGLINNTHMLRETTVEDVLKGQELVKSVSKKLNIPIKYISTLERIAQKISKMNLEGEIFPIKMYMREDWM